MKLLLTSGGITNPTIRSALLDMLGKPIAESNAICIPTAQWGHPMCGPSRSGASSPMSPGQGCATWAGSRWACSELTALPTIGEERWVPWIREADVLLVDGGDAVYLRHWLRESGLEDVLPSLTDTVWVGVSAGSMVMTPRIGEDFMNWQPPTGGDATLGVVDFSIFPHLDHEMMPDNTLAGAERWAAGLGNPAYAMDDESAIAVVDGNVEVISEGQWKLLAP